MSGGMPRFSMPTRQRRKSSRTMNTLRGGIHIFALVLAVGLLLYQLFSSVALALNQSYWVGMRSLAAAAFPILIAVYFAFLANLKVPSNSSQAPIINNYVLFLLWTMLLFGIDGYSQLRQFPLEEILYSLTIAFMIWRYKRQESLKDLMACGYGILTGSLASVILFGWNPTAL